MQKFYLIPFLKSAKSGVKSGMVSLMLAITFFIQLSLPAVAAEAQTINNTNISFTANNITLREVFKIIERKSNFLIGYDNVIDTKKRVSLTVDDKSVYSVLKQLLKDYKGSVTQVDDNHVLIKVEKQEDVTIGVPVKTVKPAAQVEVHGVVTDFKDEPLPGVTVIDKASGKKVATDVDGRYSISSSTGSTLSFNYIGYDRSEVLITGQSVVNVHLKESSNSLQEVVAIGYQTVRKSDVTGAISSVKASDLNLTTPSLGQALVGKVAGVQVSQTDGAPYAGMKIRVRGVGSLNASTDPLYVVDGYPAGNNISINSEDIESIDILKDAASAAIYGSRAAGGVVLITTKKGKDGKGKFEYDVQFGISQLEKKIKLMNSTQFTNLVISARNNSYKDLWIAKGKVWNDSMYSDDNATRVTNVGNSGSVSIPTSMYNFATQSAIAPQYNTDWQGVLYDNSAAFQRHNLSFSGGTDKVKYFVSSGYQDNNGIVKNTSSKTINFRSNIEAQVNDRMKVGANVSYTQNTNKEVNEGRFSPMMSALLYLPTLPAIDAGGNPIQYGQDALANQFGFQGIENPLATVQQIKDNRVGYRSVYNAYATYDIIKGLTFKANVGAQTYNQKYDYYQPTSLSDGANNPPFSTQSMTDAYATAQTISQTDKLGEFTLNYDKSLGKHHFDLLAGYSAQQSTSDIISVTAKGFTNDNIEEITAKGADATLFTLNNSGTNPTAKSVNTLLSYFGRFTYNYDSRYFLSGTLRTDGSSRFGPNNKWGTFPSVSAGWSLSQEHWYNEFLGAQSSVKVRASWGLSGNNNIPNYRSVQTVAPPSGAVFGSGTVTTAEFANSIQDANLGWESTSQYNLGTDITILKGRLSFIANYYLSESYNLLFNQPISAVSGTSSILTNLKNSKIQNKGFDFQLDGKLIQKRDFSLGLSGNISFNRNKVLNMGGASTIYTAGAERSYITSITEQGQPVGMFYGYKVAGQVTAENIKTVANSSFSTTPLKVGDLYFEDLNHDGVINSNDRQIIGSPYAKFTYGFALNASYKAFDFRAAFNGSYGNKIIDGQDYYLYNGEGSGNNYAIESDPNVLNYPPSRAGSQSNSTRLSSFYVQDGSYLRATEISAGYTLPKSLSQRLTVQSIRFYAAVSNAFTLTKYRGYNPDVDYGYNQYNTGTNTTGSNASANLAPGVDYGGYPLARTYSLGLKVTF